MSVWEFATVTYWLTLSISAYSSESEYSCEVLVSEPWPMPLFVPQDSAIIINCTTGNDTPFWSIDLANDSTDTQYHFSTRNDTLNAHGVYELPRIKTPGMPPTLGLLINDTAINNQTEIFCVGINNKSYHTMLISSLEFEPTQLGLNISTVNMSTVTVNVLWDKISSSTVPSYKVMMISDTSQSYNVIQLSDSYYIFTAPEGAPPCEVYNFSVTATYDTDGATYTGAGCGVQSSDILVLHGANLSDTSDLWTEVNLLGELIFNITVEQSCTNVIYTLEPAQNTLKLLPESLDYGQNYQTVNSIAYKFSIPVLFMKEGGSTNNIRLYTTNETDVQNNSMKVKFRCELDGTNNLQCTLVLNCAYSDVILKLSGDSNSNLIKMNSSSFCQKRVDHNIDDRSFDNSLELTPGHRVITQNLGTNWTCTSDLIIPGTKPRVTIIIVMVSLIFIGIIMGVVCVSVLCTIKRQKMSVRKHTTSMPSQYELQNGGQNLTNLAVYQEIAEGQTSVPQQVPVPLYDHVNLNGSHKLTSTDGEAEYSVTQHVLQQLSTDHGGGESGHTNYAKLQKDENHHYHTLERDREPRGVEVNLSIEKNDSTPSPSDSTPGGQI